MTWDCWVPLDFLLHTGFAGQFPCLPSNQFGKESRTISTLILHKMKQRTTEKDRYGKQHMYQACQEQVIVKPGVYIHLGQDPLMQNFGCYGCIRTPGPQSVMLLGRL